MLFNSYLFLFVFLPLALGGYGLACRIGRRAAALWLVAASFAFYAWWNPAYVLLLAGSIAFNYAVAEGIDRLSARPRLQAAALTACIGANVATLIYFKYLGAIIAAATGSGLISMPVPSIVLPLGISFFTFTQIGYLIDRRQGVTDNRGPLDYLLFVTFFPHLIAGPILHNREMMPQFADERTYRLSRQNIGVGLTIFTIGLVKKCLLADPLSATVAAGFAHSGGLPLLASWDTALCASLQIYFDFSGYSDMAIGLARLFNIRFPLNFNSPYRAASMIEHWQRWHMTLSRYLALYIYNPVALAITRRRARLGLGINRAAQATPSGFIAMIGFPTLFTMLVAGAWHGAGLQYLIFGLLHGSYLVINHAWRICRGSASRPATRPLAHVGNVAVTYVASVVAMVFFRAPGVGAAWSVLNGMAGLHGFGRIAIPHALAAGLPAFPALRGIVDPVSHGIFFASACHVIGLAGLFAIVWFAPNTSVIMRNFEPALGRPPAASARLAWQPTPSWGVATGVLACLGVLAVGGTTEFLYFQF